MDLPTAAFVVWAAVLEARKPRRGAPVLILLGLAGLLRPEAWLYAGAYWLWLVADPAIRRDGRQGTVPCPRRLIRLTALAAAAPLIWLVSDLLITGNAIHSLSGTHDLAAELGRKTGITYLPEVGSAAAWRDPSAAGALAAVAGSSSAFYMRRKVALPLAIAG